MKIAVQGCAHGELENIYDTIEYIEKQNNITVDLLLCCGDFQATRNLDDLKSMAVPPKFRSLCTFYKYYSGEKLAPKLTIFIGGNHEASNYLQELPYGGWVAPNIYYLGYAGVVNVAGIRVAGLSGIFKGWDFPKGRYEKPPYNEESLRSCYHIRNLDVFRLKQLTGAVHIMLSHDWPSGITNHGNVKSLLKAKPFFKEEIESDTLGNKPAAELLECLKPDYWFAAHLHVKFAALVKHNNGSEPKTTKFLSLDKCLPKRKFLQIIDLPHDQESEIKLKYDLEWLTILYLTNHLISIHKLNTYMPGPGCNERWIFTPTEEELGITIKKFHNDLVVPKNFVPTAPAHKSNSNKFEDCGKQPRFNPQTIEFCNKLGVDDPMTLLLNEGGFHNNSSINLSTFESSSFIEDSETEFSSPAKKSFLRTPLKLPEPNFDISESKEDLSSSAVKDLLTLPESSITPMNNSVADELSSSSEENKNSSYVSNGIYGSGGPNALPVTSTPVASKYEPYFDPMTPRNVTALVGNSAYLTCIVKNLANKTVSWIRHRDIHILTVGGYTYTSDQRFMATHHRDNDEWTLQIKFAQKRDAGVYECQISTQPVRSYFVNLNVVDDIPPSKVQKGSGHSDGGRWFNEDVDDDDIYHQMVQDRNYGGPVPTASILGGPDLHVDKGSTINLTCLIKYSPKPPAFIFWYHHDEVISYDSSRGGVSVITEKGEVTTSYLLIQHAELSDSGKYSCSPSNADVASVRVHVLNGEKPAAMQTGSAGLSNSSLNILALLFLVFLYSVALENVAWTVNFR